jgi:hypothetical protein
MPVANQPVFSPASGAPIQSAWGQGVANAVNQVFGSVTERDTDWTSPPDGSICYVTGTGRSYRRVAGAWQTIPIVAAANASCTTDASGNGLVTPGFPVAFPAGTTPVIVAFCTSYANVGVIPFNVLNTQWSAGLRRPADNSLVQNVSVAISYTAVLM